MIPYTYLIGWTKHNAFYYGVRYSGTCHPSDLWVSYFTSSNSVKKFRAEFGEPDIIQVRKTFSSTSKARTFETKVLRRIKVKIRKDFLNKVDKPCPSFLGGRHSIETKAKMRASAHRTPRSQEVRDKISVGNKGRVHSLNEVLKMKNSLTGYKHTNQAKENMSSSRIGLKPSSETKSKMSQASARGNHVRAVRCQYDGKSFDCLVDAVDYSGTTRHFVETHKSFMRLIT